MDRHSILPAMVGLLFFTGWWIIIGVAAQYPNGSNIDNAYYTCGVFGTIFAFRLCILFEARYGLRAQEHDLVHAGEFDIRVLDQPLCLIRRNIDERRVIADFWQSGMMDDLATHPVNLVFNLHKGAIALFAILVKPQFDLEADRRIGIVAQGLAPILDHFRQHSVLRSPRSHIDQQGEEFAPLRPAGRHSLAALVAPPESEQLLQGAHVRHREIDAACDRLLGLVSVVEVFVRLDILFIVAEIFEPQFLRLRIEVFELAREFEHDRALWSDRRRVVL